MKIELSEQDVQSIETLLRMGLINGLQGQQANEAVEVYNVWRKAVSEAAKPGGKKPIKSQ